MPGAEKPAPIDSDGQARDLSSLMDDWSPRTLVEGLARVADADIQSLPVISAPFRYGTPLEGVGKVIGVGLNYRVPAEEAGLALPTEPVFFLKATSRSSARTTMSCSPRTRLRATVRSSLPC